MIPAAPRRSPVYTGTGAVATYAFGFKVFSTADVSVVVADLNGAETTLALGADFSVSLNADQDSFPGGSITLLAGNLATGFRLVVVGNLAYSQTAQLPNGGSYNATVVERALDRTVVLIQQVLEQSQRGLILAATAGEGVSVSLPSPQALSVVGWDVTGLALRNFTPGDLGVNVTYAQWRTQLFSGTGAQTAFVLDFDAGSASNIDLRVNNVPQTPNVNFTYTQATRTITFTTGAPAAGSNNVVARYGQALPQGTFDLADNTVTGAKLVDNSIGTAKLANDAVTFAKMQNIATARMLGRTTAGSGDIEELTGVQVAALVAAATTGAQGAVRLATAAEAPVRANATQALTPATLRDALAAQNDAPIFACRAWVNFNGTGTLAVRASGNVASVVDNGAGDYTINFQNPMPDANYVVLVTPAALNGNVIMGYESRTTARSASAVRVFVTSTGPGADSESVNVAIFR